MIEGTPMLRCDIDQFIKNKIEITSLMTNMDLKAANMLTGADVSVEGCNTVTFKTQQHMTENQNEAVKLICGLLSCHSPAEQNEIIEKVLEAKAIAVAMRMRETAEKRGLAADDGERFLKIAGKGEDYLKAAEDIVNNAKKDQVHN